MHDLKTVTFDASTHQLVPKVPSSDMLDRAVAFALNVKLGGNYNWSAYMSDVWERMLSIAPAPAAQSAWQEAYAYVYEYDMPDCVHRQLTPGTWNGMQPSRVVTVYAAPVNGGERTIEVAIALEQQRTLAIIKAVRDQHFGTSNPDLPTQASAAFDLACEEIEHRLRTEQWTLGGVPAPLPDVDAPQVGKDAELMCRRLRNMGLGTCDEAADFIERLAALSSPAKVGEFNKATKDQIAAVLLHSHDRTPEQDAQLASHLAGGDPAKVGRDERDVVERMARAMNIATDGHDRYWAGYVKSAEAAYRAALASPAKVGGDELEAFEREASILSYRIAKDEDGDYLALDTAIAFNLFKALKARAALSADGGEIEARAKTVHRRIDSLCDAANTPEADYFDASTNMMIATRELLTAIGHPHAMDVATIAAKRAKGDA